MIRTVFINIISWLQSHQLPCLIKVIFHIDCPGCGFQRSFIALIAGNVKESFLLYPALIPMLLFIFLLLIQTRVTIFNQQKLVKIGLYSIFIIILFFYIIKLTT